MTDDFLLLVMAEDVVRPTAYTLRSKLVSPYRHKFGSTGLSGRPGRFHEVHSPSSRASLLSHITERQNCYYLKFLLC